jgi:urea-proton symporter
MKAFITPQTAIVLLAGLSSLWIGLGFYYNKKMNKTSNDFLFAGRNVGMALSTATLLAAWVTGNSMMSAPEQGLTIGIGALIGYTTCGFGLVFFAPLAIRIKKIMPKGCTSGDFIRLRYGKVAWAIFLVLSVYYFLGFLMTQAMGGGLLIQALSGLDYRVGMLVIIGVTTLYTLKGGMRAIVTTDFIQCLLILFVLFLTAALAYGKLGFDNVYHGVMASQPERMNILAWAGIMQAFSNLIFSWGEIFAGNIWWQRLYSSNEKVIARSYILAGFTWMAVPLVSGSMALVTIAMGIDVPQVNMVFPILASTILGTLGSVMVFIVIYSALASTLSCLLSSSADLIVQDIYKQLINPKATDEQILKLAKILIVSLAVFTVILAWEPRTTMYKLLMLTGPAVSSMVWPIAYGLYKRESSAKAAIWAMLIGMAAGLYGYFVISPFAAPICSITASAIIMWVGTLIAPNKEFKWTQLSEDV